MGSGAGVAHRIGKQGDIRFGGRDSVSGAGERDDWQTPPDLLGEIYLRWNLDFDPCPYPREPGYDGLKVPWHGRPYVNPPYSSEMRLWIEKAVRELGGGRIEVAVFLIHSRTDTKVFHESILPNASELWFVKGRVKFVPPGDREAQSSPFPSLIAVLKKDPGEALIAGTWDLATGKRTARSAQRRLE